MRAFKVMGRRKIDWHILLTLLPDKPLLLEAMHPHALGALLAYTLAKRLVDGMGPFVGVDGVLRENHNSGVCAEWVVTGQGALN